MALKLNLKLRFGSFLFASFAMISFNASAANYSYKSFFSSCPHKSAAEFALIIAKNLEEKKTLGDLKQYFETSKIPERYFVSYYKVGINPVSSKVTIKLDCPNPLYKVTFFGDKENGPSVYDDLILASDGNFYSKAFVELLKEEGKFSKTLPVLALPESKYGKIIKLDLEQVATKVYGLELEKSLTEIIVNKDDSLTFIMSVDTHPMTVFLGKDEWVEKISKLGRIVKFLPSQNKAPSIINMSNSKKVVVKFSQ